MHDCSAHPKADSATDDQKKNIRSFHGFLRRLSPLKKVTVSRSENQSRDRSA
jgi:hypothetical protein